MKFHSVLRSVWFQATQAEAETLSFPSFQSRPSSSETPFARCALPSIKTLSTSLLHILRVIPRTLKPAQRRDVASSVRSNAIGERRTTGKRKRADGLEKFQKKHDCRLTDSNSFIESRGSHLSRGD